MRVVPRNPRFVPWDERGFFVYRAHPPPAKAKEVKKLIIVTRKDISKEDYARIERRLTELGFKLHPIVGVERIVIGAIGDRRMIDAQSLASLPGVEQVIPILHPYKLASREAKPEGTRILIRPGLEIGGRQLLVMAGPCAVEGREQLLEAARAIAAALRAGRHVYLTQDGQLSLDRPSAGWELKMPRAGLYVPWTANMDAGWTQWLFDQFQTPYEVLRNADIRRGGLRARFDVIVLAQQTMQSILHGTPEVVQLRAGETARQRPEYTGGIGLEGAGQLEEFVRAGGTLIAFDQATELPLTLFPIDGRGGLRSVAGGEGQSQEQAGGWFCPGSVLRMTADPKHPLAFGMPAEHYATSTGGQFFEIRESAAERRPRAFVWYAKSNLLASGWVSGERVVAGKPAAVEAPLGKGRVVLFGFRPQFRGQTFGTFRLVLNAVWQSSAAPLE